MLFTFTVIFILYSLWEALFGDNKTPAGEEKTPDKKKPSADKKKPSVDKKTPEGSKPEGSDEASISQYPPDERTAADEAAEKAADKARQALLRKALIVGVVGAFIIKIIEWYNKK